ncbi:MAG TPA: ABC transporter ATP-binding protein [Polyangiales bacterium]|nr:ABC transporter ATP-binding protein [Polyangiales bacterium]
MLRDRPSSLFFSALYRAAPAHAVGFWLCLAASAALPAALAVSSGALISAITSSKPLTTPLIVVGSLFLIAQVLPQLQHALNSNLGSLTASYFFDRILRACVAPAGVKHLEDPELAKDLVVARDFELGITGPPLSIGIDFIAGGLVLLFSGIASAIVLFGYAFWAAPLLAAAWGATHWLLRESAIWKDRETDAVRSAERHADYAYRLAVDAPAAKELRLFGLAEWVIERFVSRRTRLYELRWQATRLRERSLLAALAIVLAANGVVLGMIVHDLASGALSLGQAVTFLQAAVGSSAIAFGGLSWALDGAGAVAKAVARLDGRMQAVGALPNGARPASGLPRREIRFRGVSFAYAPDARPVLDNFDLTIPAGSSLAIVGVNGAGKTTLAKLLCRLYDPTSGAIEVDGIDLRELDVAAWRSRLTAVFQDYVRYELELRSNVAPLGAPDDAVRSALQHAGAEQLAALDTILSRGYPGGTDLSGGQWQRVALARALCAVQLGAGVVLLDEPTAQLDVRGEAEIFERILAATRECTTILVSHRFSTVRQADRICVLEAGRVVELGSHEELMALGGRYRTMFDLQAARFVELDEQGVEVVHDTL